MVCHRWELAVEDILRKTGIPFLKILMGEVLLGKELSKEKRALLAVQLNLVGFELLDNKKTVLIEKIKVVVLKYLSQLPEIAKLKLSFFIANELKHEYSYLSNLFSTTEGYTIEHYYIKQRIEKVKELMVYNQLSLSEIAYNLGFSNVHHLSSQFKKSTGISPTNFKQIGSQKNRVIGK